MLSTDAGDKRSYDIRSRVLLLSGAVTWIQQGEAVKPQADSLMIIVVNIGINGLCQRRNAVKFLRPEVPDLSVPKKLSAIALSKQLPFPDISCTTPAARSLSC